MKHQFNQAGQNRHNNGGILSTCAETKTSLLAKNVLLATAVVNLVNKHGNIITARAILDR